MAYDLLIHSMSEFGFITLPILEAVKAQSICEIGAEHGGNSKLLYQWLLTRNGTLYSIDPAPSPDFLNWVTEVNHVVKHISKLSLQAIPDLSSIDAWFIDGDHNWYTVYHELTAIHRLNRQQNKPILIFLHDIAWPWQHRDLYYTPETIPAEYRHPHSFELGVTYDSAQLILGGFRGHGHYAIALHEGGAKNGVLTAIHDFMSEHAGQFKLASIPAVFGLGILYDQTHPQADRISALLSPYHNNPLLQQLEKNRLANYLKVIEWQDRAPKVEQQHASEITRLQYIIMQHLVQTLIEKIEDDIDHPELWEGLGFSTKEEQQRSLPVMTDYLEKLLAIPQEEKAYKLLSIVYSICLAHLEQYTQAKKILENLTVHYSQCSLVAGALFFVNTLEDPNNPKFDLHNKICKTPFEQIDVLENSAHLCCASWLHTSIGNLQTEDWHDVWNSENAQKIRLSILEGRYNYCNKMLCPIIQGNQLTPKYQLKETSEHWRTIIDHNKTTLDKGPDIINLAYDKTCNLACPSCRTEKFAANQQLRDAYESMQEKNILPLLRTAKIAFITGSGDPFASKNFRKLMLSINKKDFPDLKLQLMTNAMLLTAKEWQNFSHLNGQIWRIRVSVDAATKKTHELLRKGAHWETVLENMKFIGSLYAAGHIDVYELVFVVQTENFREMGAAVDLAHAVGASGIYFAKLSNWGTFSDATYCDKAVFHANHPLHQDFLQCMQDPRLQSPMVYMPDLTIYVDHTARRVGHLLSQD